MSGMTCIGFLFVFTCQPQDLPPSPPAVQGATFCQIARPITWDASDTRLTKEQVDRHNRQWVRLCRDRQQVSR